MNEMPVCPCCSVPPHAYFRPTWFLSRRLSDEKGQQHWLLNGCQHARRIAPVKAVDEATCDAIEANWAKECDTLFAALTERWTNEQRENFRQQLKAEIKFLL